MNLRLKLKWLAVNVASALLTVSLVVLVTALAYPRIHDYVPIGPPPKGAAHLSMIFGSIASSFVLWFFFFCRGARWKAEIDACQQR